MKIVNSAVKYLVKLINKVEESIDRQRSKRAFDKNAYDILWSRAAYESADYIEEHIDNIMLFRSSYEMWDYTHDKLSAHESGKVLEFGVATGDSINYLSKNLAQYDFFGFDSFEGLPEAWMGHHAKKGGYSQLGKHPKVNGNVQLIEGWFENTLPIFINKTSANDIIRLIHIDSDIYSSCVTILKELENVIVPGTLILFDEYLGYPNWKNGEYRAFKEFILRTSKTYEYLAFSKGQCLLIIKD